MTAKPSTDPSRRGVLLDAAARLVTHRGPNKTTVADIAREAGVSVGSVYLEFKKGKGAILAALSARRFEQVLAAMHAAATEGPAAQRLRRALDARTTVLRELDVEAPAEDIARCKCSDLVETWADFRARSDALIAGLVAEGIAQGELVGAPEATAGAVNRAYAGFLPPALHRLPVDELRSALEAMHALVLDGLRRRP